MKTVWKEGLRPGENKVLVPKGAEFISVGWQDLQVVVWFYVPDTDVPNEPRYLLWIGTSKPIEDEVKFIGSVKQPQSPFVWHIFEVLS